MAARFVYVGSAFHAQAKVPASPGYGKVELKEQRQGIVIFKVAADGHSLEPAGMLELPFHLGWLAYHPSNGHLYGIGGGKLHAFTVAADGALNLVSSADTMGSSTYLEISQDGKWALVGNYFNGVAAVLPILPDGSVGEATDSKHHCVPLNPALADRQEACHPHQARLCPKTGAWALFCDLGADRVWVYAFDSVRGSLVGAENSARHFRLPEGSGPRHLDFHPNGRFVYILCELSGNVVTCTWDETEGRLVAVQSIYALPEGTACSRAHHSGASHILVAPDGRTVYTSSRTDSQMTVFRVDEATGHLTKLQHVFSEGICPRHFHLDWSSAEPRLRLGNQDSQNLVAFAINPEDGLLRDSPTVLPLPSVCPQVVTAPVTPLAATA